MTFKKAEMIIGDIKQKFYEEYGEQEIQALNMAEEALCILSDVTAIVKQYQDENKTIYV